MINFVTRLNFVIFVLLLANHLLLYFTMMRMMNDGDGDGDDDDGDDDDEEDDAFDDGDAKDGLCF